jgi:hypothetical protein
MRTNRHPQDYNRAPKPIPAEYLDAYYRQRDYLDDVLRAYQWGWITTFEFRNLAQRSPQWTELRLDRAAQVAAGRE